MSSSTQDPPSSPLIIKDLSTLASKSPQDPSATSLPREEPSNPLPSAFDSSSSTADLYGVSTSMSSHPKKDAPPEDPESNESQQARKPAPSPLPLREGAENAEPKTADNPPTSATWRPTFFREQSWSQEDRKRQMHEGLMGPPSSSAAKGQERGWSAKE